MSWGASLHTPTAAYGPTIRQALYSRFALPGEAHRGKLSEATSSTSSGCRLFETRYEARHHFLVGSVYFAWAELLHLQGQAQEADTMLRKAAVICDGSFGPNHLFSNTLRQKLATLDNVDTGYL